MRMRISFLPKRSDSSFEIDRPMVVGCWLCVGGCKKGRRSVKKKKKKSQRGAMIIY
jgi:TPP-dependent indolepyruvate ferredoxin oxidoreductase alpha subunit